ncbi:HlyD family efflux transporter periplasmic adaptor subunit [Clostridium perfringens]|uniref:HlyD family efflux transporter periplasmic adaptor subunit n=2 Tax=Clostridium perfringens TaxID=1502 RepID=UPI001ABB5D24|nr:HlyD family efflux transporter periplasmic adaptor subunit [Clostridium perfringens]EHK2389731.1 HlyD family efflux transporter periplasmic adaptor subunit [Clostridium perfringens]EIF2088275.1 HlyD family efflux transporter periplasmic adaptor subunit [Clostridium perfringens]ELC8355142.1 HlyD family efflux transporter periplasmic adaptor subunit [Clostridium perfringens]ELC8411723.1 HlyD family efflux transporter periplasmic adaptor subunit [Clostridium perfringens]MBO3395945.1 HlyD famil
MKFKIDNIENLSDSRQAMESKPNKFIQIFIYILIAIIVTFLMWAWFSEKEIVVKVNGVVRPDNEIQSISNIVQGEVKSVSMKSGEEVKKGDVLFEINSSELQDKKNQINEQIDYFKTDSENLEKLNKSINDNTNYFENNDEDKEYYYKFKSYEAGNKVALGEKENITTSKDELTKEKINLETLSKSVSENKNYNEDGSAYSAQYESYISSREIISNKIEQLEFNKKFINEEIESNNKKLEKTNKENNEDQVIKEKNNQLKNQMGQIDLEIKNNNDELEKLKSETIAQIKGNIEKLNQEISKLDNNINSFDESINISKDKNKTTILAQIEEKINLNNQKKKELEENKKEIDQSIEKCVVKAPVDGKLKTNGNLEKGVVLQTGAIIATILPKDNTYKINLMIPNKDIANIKEGEDIKYSFESLPYREYGFLNGRVESISPDSTVDTEKGISFFNGEGSLSSNVLYSNKGEESYIKSGMTCEARIITRKEKMLYYLLEKIGFKN